MRGRKEWALWPPAAASYAQRHVQLSMDAASNATGSRPLRCVQRAGDVVLVPPLWGHATLNLEPSVGWATEVLFDRAMSIA